MKRVSNILKRWSTDQLITGIELNDWITMLRENQFKVSREYFHRAAWVTGWSMPATILGKIEDAMWGRKLASYEIDPEPLFLLGHWRSGTTHLHNLLGRDPNHTFPTVLQVVFPSCFLSTDQLIPALTSGMMDETRTYDNVKQGWEEAAEDEIALAKLTGMSPYISFMFPDNSARYERYVDFQEVTGDERERWKEAFRWFIKKIMISTGGKRVIVKSCTHTARIPLLLEMFPNAKFVHIHRHPYEVFASTLHMRSHTDWENFFQLPEDSVEETRHVQTALLGRRVFERYLEDRHLIPEENLIELAYDDVCGNEMAVTETIYKQFELPGWEHYKPILEEYLSGIAGYKRNKLDIDQELKDEVYDEWRLVFDNYEYPREYPA